MSSGQVVENLFLSSIPAYLCLTDFVKLLFIGGTKSVICTVLESKYNMKDEKVFLDSAVEAKGATSAPTALADRRISQLEAEIATLRFSLGSGGGFSSRGSSSCGGSGAGCGTGNSLLAPQRFQQLLGAAPANFSGLTYCQRV